MADGMVGNTDTIVGGASVCSADANLFVAAEQALNNGVGAVLVVDKGNKLLGEATLDTLRAAIKEGAHLKDARVTVAMVAAATRMRSGPAHKGRRLVGIVDAQGHLLEAEVTHNAEFVPVAEPLLSSAEFRNLTDAFLSTWISSTGQYIRDFEAKFARSHGMAEGIAVSNGTVSLHLALAALGIGPGDEVIVPDFTFAATINTVIHVGATPVIVDVDQETWAMSIEGLQRAITPRTRAIIPVHVFGRPAPMVEIAAIAAKHGLYVIEDCAEAHGAKVGGKFVGEYSHIASFSFFANKILTTGEGGICLTNDTILAQRLRTLRDHGMNPQRRYWHDEPGFNFRMTNLQASIGCAQIDRFDEILDIRRDVEARYRLKLARFADVVMPIEADPRSEPVAWFACALVPSDKRAALIEACKQRDIDLRPFFNALSVMPAYRKWARPCPVSMYLSGSGINLPTSHRIDDAVMDALVEAFATVLPSS
jgi:perosamine synthetase